MDVIGFLSASRKIRAQVHRHIDNHGIPLAGLELGKMLRLVKQCEALGVPKAALGELAMYLTVAAKAFKAESDQAKKPSPTPLSKLYRLSENEEVRRSCSDSLDPVLGLYGRLGVFGNCRYCNPELPSID